MTQFTSLLDLQDHDTAVDQVRHRLASLPERVALTANRAAVSGLSSRMATVQKERDELGARQEALEHQIGTARSRKAEIEKRMFGGQVTAARELQAMDEEVRHLGQHVRELEDRELEIMEELEPLDDRLTVAAAETATLEEEAGTLRAAITVAEGDLQGDLDRLLGERAALAGSVPAELLARYETLRTRLGGTGAARLVGGSCGGCHLVLPAMEVDRIRKAPPDAVMTCDQCGRILVR